MIVLRCGKCKEAYPDLALDACASCGAGTSMIRMSVSQYWFDLAKEYGYPDTVAAAELVRDLYLEWDTSTYRTFKDFMDGEVLSVG